MAVLLFLILAVSLTAVPARAGAEVLKSWEDVRSFFDALRKGRASRASFTLSRALLAEIKADNDLLPAAAVRGGCRLGPWSYWPDGRVEVSSVTPLDCPFRTVSGKEELTEAVKEMRRIRAERFVLLAGKELCREVMNDSSRRRLFLMAGGLFEWDRCSFIDALGCWEFHGCRYWNGAAAWAKDETEMLTFLRKYGALGYDSFALFTDRAVFERLAAADCERMSALMTAAFIEVSVSYSREDRCFILHKSGGSVFFPGYVIARAVRLGNTDALPPRLKETLRAAEGMAAGITGTPREIALAVHDLLCARVTYSIDGIEHSEDDCCIGAILNGKANCDGYADAFMLLCALKGIPVELVAGESKKKTGAEDPGHMWNLVYLDGLWRGVDVTWDDQESGAICRHFNMGLDRMKENYVFVSDFLPRAVLGETDPLDRPVPEFRISSARDIDAALHRCAALKRTGADLYLTDRLFREYRSDGGLIRARLDLAGLGGNARYGTDRPVILLRDLAPLDPSVLAKEASSPREFVSVLREAASRDVKEVRVYCSDALFSAFTDDRSEIRSWLADAGLTGASVKYSPAAKLIILGQLRR